MRTHIIALAAAILLAPTTLAGSVDTETGYLTGDSSCTGESRHTWNGEWSETGSWWYEHGEESSSCSDSFTYLETTASDDDGELASASASANNGSSSSASWTSFGSSYRYDEDGDGWYEGGGSNDWHDSFREGADAWDRRVDVATREGDASVVRGCSSETTEESHKNGYSYWYRPPRNDTPPPPPPPNETEPPTTQNHDGSYGGSRASQTRTETWDSGCGNGASLSRDGSTAAAGQREGCDSTSRSTGDHESSYGPGGWYGYDRFESESDSVCTYDAYASFDGNEVSAGPGSDCTYERYSFDSYGSSYSYGSTRDQHSCTSGAHVRGPDGIHAFAGESSTSSSTCDRSPDWNSTCYDWSWSSRYATVDWAHNPLGPDPIWIFLP